jgi:hypothetical protein
MDVISERVANPVQYIVRIGPNVFRLRSDYVHEYLNRLNITRFPIELSSTYH